MSVLLKVVGVKKVVVGFRSTTCTHLRGRLTSNGDKLVVLTKGKMTYIKIENYYDSMTTLIVDDKTLYHY